MKKIIFITFALSLSACSDDQKDDNKLSTTASNSSESSQIDIGQNKPAPLPPASPTDNSSINGLELELLDYNGACQLNDGSSIRFLRPMAPCHFVRIAGSLQVYKKGKTDVIALVGTPVKEDRCGQEVQGLLITNGKVEISQNIGQGSTFCANEGLDGFHFSLF